MKTLFILALPAMLLAQSGPAVIGAGSLNPAVFRVAPGEVVKVWVNNAKTLLPHPGGTPVRVQRATSVPLPTSLAGFSVRVHQGSKTYPAPIFSVEQVPICAYTMQNPNPPSTPDCWVTALMIQIPPEIVPIPLQIFDRTPATMIVSEGDTDSTAIAVFPYLDNIHMLTTCGSNSGLTEDRCGRIVTHADGTLVSVSAPAKPGETVVIYAFGLGQTTPTVKAGDVTPTPAPVLADFTYPFLGERMGLRLDSRANAGPSAPHGAPVIPEFVGLTPGQAGLYQINVKLPNSSPAVEPCTTDSSLIRSNFTFSFGGFNSFDGAAICVQPAQ